MKKLRVPKGQQAQTWLRLLMESDARGFADSRRQRWQFKWMYIAAHGGRQGVKRSRERAAEIARTVPGAALAQAFTAALGQAIKKTKQRRKR